MGCWQCGAEVPLGKIGFRDLCEKCGAGLHSCNGCKFHNPNLYNECAVPGTEWVSDRARNNFCEEFSPGSKPPKKPTSNKSFDDLFD